MIIIWSSFKPVTLNLGKHFEKRIQVSWRPPYWDRHIGHDSEWNVDPNLYTTSLGRFREFSRTAIAERCFQWKYVTELNTSSRLFTEKYNFLQASLNWLLFYLHNSAPRCLMWYWKSRTMLTNASESPYSRHFYFEIVNTKEFVSVTKTTAIIARNLVWKVLYFNHLRESVELVNP